MFYSILQKFFFFLSIYLNNVVNFFQSFGLTPVKKELLKSKKFEYVPVTYEEFAVIVDRFKKKLHQNGFGDSSFLIKIEKLFIEIKKLFDLADKYSCGYTRANGYYSILRLITSTMECAVNEFSSFENQRNFYSIKLEELIVDYEELIDLSLILIERLILLVDLTNLENEKAEQDLENELIKYSEFHRGLKIFKKIKIKIEEEDPNKEDQEFDSLPLLTPNLKLICDSIYEAISQLTIKKDIIYRKFPACYLKNNLNWIYWICMLAVSSIKVHFYQLPKLFLNDRFRSDICNKISCCVTTNFPFEYLDLLDFFPLALVTKFLTFYSNTKCREVRIPSQTSIIINATANDKLTFNDLNRINFDDGNRRIRCRFLSPKNMDLNQCNELMVHYHGGGFFCLSKDSHDTYLKPWVDHYRVPILTVDYQLKQAFPAGLKDSFDVYLWLRVAPEEEVRSLLGYYPNKLILVGESSGGNFSLSITTILNDIRNNHSRFKVSIKMPDAVVLFYSPLFISVYASPSRSISTFDILVSTGILLIIWEGISGLIPNLRQNTTLEKILLFLFPKSRDSPNWLNGPENEFKKKIEFLAKNVTSTYLSPLFYDKFDQITEVPMYLISAEFCPFLDDLISLAKIWKGPLQVDVLSGFSHGFLHYGGFRVNQNLSEAMLFCGQKIVKLFNKK